jgi:predicted O-methyltransferase YrrM
MDDAVENYLTDLAKTEHDDPVLDEMEARAEEHGFPIVGRATGATWSWRPGRSARSG